MGEPAGPGRLERLRGRLPRARQHRPDRPLPPARRAGCSSSPTAPAGWASTRSAWPRSRRSSTTAAGRRPISSSSSSSTSRSSRDAFESQGLWDEADGFFYDRLRLPGRPRGADHACARSSACCPLLGVAAIDEDVVERAETVNKRAAELLEAAHPVSGGAGAPPDAARRRRRRARAPRCSPGSSTSRSSSRPTGCAPSRAAAAEHPFVLDVDGMHSTIDYEPAESTTGMFGGNSNWRGPIWMPVNFLVVEALTRYARFFGDELKVEYPTGSGREHTLDEIAADLRERLISLFLVGDDGRRPCFGWVERLQTDPAWKDNVLFNEYFHGDNGAGLGASHQTGWTGLVAELILRAPRRAGADARRADVGSARRRRRHDDPLRAAGVRRPRRGGRARVARRRRRRRLRDGHGRRASAPAATTGCSSSRSTGPAAGCSAWRRSIRCSSLGDARDPPRDRRMGRRHGRPARPRAARLVRPRPTASRAGAGRSAASCSSASSRPRTARRRSASSTACSRRDRPVTLELTPLCTWRDVHGERHADGGPAASSRRASGFAFEGAYRVEGPGWQPGGEWYRGVRAREEAARGLSDREDLWAAGTFRAELEPGARPRGDRGAPRRSTGACRAPRRSSPARASGRRT